MLTQRRQKRYCTARRNLIALLGPEHPGEKIVELLTFCGWRRLRIHTTIASRAANQLQLLLCCITCRSIGHVKGKYHVPLLRQPAHNLKARLRKIFNSRENKCRSLRWDGLQQVIQTLTHLNVQLFFKQRLIALQHPTSTHLTSRKLTGGHNLIKFCKILWSKLRKKFHSTLASS